MKEDFIEAIKKLKDLSTTIRSVNETLIVLILKIETVIEKLEPTNKSSDRDNDHMESSIGSTNEWNIH